MIKDYKTLQDSIMDQILDYQEELIKREELAENILKLVDQFNQTDTEKEI